MPIGEYYCDHCGKRFVKFHKYCPRCGSETSVSEILTNRIARDFFARLSLPAQISIIAIILITIGTTGYFALGLFRPESIVQVRTGSLYECRICGKRYAENIRTIKVPITESKKYKVETEKGLCRKCAREEVTVKSGTMIQCKKCGRVVEDTTKTVRVPREDAHRYSVSKINVELCAVCARAERIISRNPNWAYEAASLIAAGEVAVGMTTAQAQAAWRQTPAWIEKFHSRKGISEKWVYGDPILNIPVGDRFFIIENGKVIYYEDP